MTPTNPHASSRPTGSERPSSLTELDGTQDAAVIRALAHPVRLAILQFLAIRGAATSGACARFADIAAGSASYHLHALAKAGLISRVEADDARQTVWEVDASPAVDLDLDGSAAKVTLRLAAAARNEAIVREYLTDRESLPEAWQDSFTYQNVLALTIGEFRELGNRLEGLVSDYRPATVPEGGGRGERRLVYVSLDATPWVRAERALEDRPPRRSDGDVRAHPSVGREASADSDTERG